MNSATSTNLTRDRFIRIILNLKPTIEVAKPLRPQFDSLSLVELVSLVEEEFGAEIEFEDFSFGFLDTVEKSVEIIDRKSSKKRRAE